ncbi:MAG: bacitracin ABC transporter ATP-binding protein [Candidatus Reconcilbacillus cellulovorans]|uniref:Bacitracin ABC transporter ATP-binding protein n=1 Tax=Candidatus Reconcilbacillus cellulovorans TaxID=1906605 RepID=A0A2A6DZD3_9BACL|nr:MAG: bacitracin ABC transporter ATP-binding protein [Candidatus Reconcilbacillus cellulovorans]
MVLRAESLTKIYGSSGGALRKALDGITLDVRRGEFTAVMGPSGSGKTTLLNLLAGIDRPTSGSVRIDGTDPATLSRRDLALFRRRRIGFVFQDFNLLDNLTLRENILLPLALDRTQPDEMEARLSELARHLNIADILDKRPYEVSGGQQQRAAIARALIHEPAVVLADEPTGNLDSKSAYDVMAALRDMNENRGTTVLMVTHDPFAASFAGRVVFVKDGRLFSEIRRGDSRQLFFQRILDALGVLGGPFGEVAGPGLG